MNARTPRPMSRFLFTLAFAAALAAAGVSAAAAQVTVLRGATVHPVSGPPIADGVLVIEGSRIAAVGGPDTAIPDGATVIELSGEHLYPGFLQPTSELGLIEIGSVRGTDDTRELDGVNAHHRAEVAFNADSLLLPVAISGGVLSAHVVPGGGSFTGTSAVMRLEGWNWEDMTLASPVGLHLRYPRVAAGDDDDEGAGSSDAVAAIEKALDDARAYGKAKAAAEAGRAPRPDHDPRLEALLPLLAGELPLFLHADQRDQIESALDWAAEQGFGNLVLVSGADAAYLAERLAAEQVPVIYDGVLDTPDRDWEPYDAVFTAPARLVAAGVKVAIGNGGGASDARNLPFHAAMAAAYGLDRDEALASVTLRPAEILGVDDRLGSLEAGKEATFFIATGDPLEIRSVIERAWIAGKEVDMTQDHQKRLWEKYRNRPRP